ncbi:MAG: FG-GAP repeat domain-containing protein [Planctomycetaceae bacterium]|jgi:hypothetical protein
MKTPTVIQLMACQVFFGSLSVQPPTAYGGEKIAWKKHDINADSPYEGGGAADFNNDGRIDIFSGDSWYEAPDWTRHRVRDVPASRNPHYHEDFADSPLDVNGDGFTDIVTCNYFGRRIGWVENPGGDATQPWVEHEVDLPGSMETGVLVDLTGDGVPEFLPNTPGVVLWYSLETQQPVTWKRHECGSQGAGHGVGSGDINSDGRLDILTPNGWYEQPADSDAPWVFHGEFSLGSAGIQILGHDVDGDQLTDVIWGSGHGFGLFWLQQGRAADGSRTWKKHLIDDTFSQVHTLLLAGLSGRQQPELVTGKRVYAHESEPGATDAPVVYSYRWNPGVGNWVRETVFRGDPAVNAPATAADRAALKDFPRGSAGTGLQMSAIDIDGDGDLDLVCPGKSGLYLFENLRL